MYHAGYQVIARQEDDVVRQQVMSRVNISGKFMACDKVVAEHNQAELSNQAELGDQAELGKSSGTKRSSGARQSSGAKRPDGLSALLFRGSGRKPGG